MVPAFREHGPVEKTEKQVVVLLAEEEGFWQYKGRAKDSTQEISHLVLNLSSLPFMFCLFYFISVMG